MSRKTVFIHAGALKTGSSALQAWFARNIGELRRFGVHYPAPAKLQDAIDGRVTQGNGGAILSFVRSDEAQAETSRRKLLRALDSALASECDKILFSSELILRNGVARRYAELKAYLDERGADVIFVSLARNVADHAFSQWGQQLKAGGGTAEWDDALRRYRAPFLRHVKTVEDACGREAIVTLNYDSLKQDLVRGLLGTLGVSGMDYQPVEQVNRSLAAKEISYMLFINNWLADNGLDQQQRSRASLLVSAHVLSCGGAQPLRMSLSPEQYATLARNNSPTVEAFNREYLPADPIAIARPEQISAAIEPEPLSAADQAIAAKLAELLLDGFVQDAAVGARDDLRQARCS